MGYCNLGDLYGNQGYWQLICLADAWFTMSTWECQDMSGQTLGFWGIKVVLNHGDIMGYVVDCNLQSIITPQKWANGKCTCKCACVCVWICEPWSTNDIWDMVTNPISEESNPTGEKRPWWWIDDQSPKLPGMYRDLWTCVEKRVGATIASAGCCYDCCCCLFWRHHFQSLSRCMTPRRPIHLAHHRSLPGRP